MRSEKEYICAQKSRAFIYFWFMRKLVFLRCQIGLIFYLWYLPGSISLAKNHHLPIPPDPLYDVYFYQLEVQIDPELRRIAGSNIIHFQILKKTRIISLSLYAHWSIARIEFNGRSIPYERKEQEIRIALPYYVEKGEQLSLKVIYGGTPQESINPPWEGGFVWKEDEAKRPHISVSCGNEPASMWWPISDFPDELIDSMHFSIIIPHELEAITNGKLLSRQKISGNFLQFNYQLDSPMRAEELSLFIGDFRKYVFPSTPKEQHPVYAYLLPERKKGLAHLSQIHQVLDCFEEILGPYPSRDEPFIVIEAPYVGKSFRNMLAYGHHFANNSWGFDQVLVHEAAYQWLLFGMRPATLKDHWIHHAFATYLEGYYLECEEDYDQHMKYLRSFRDKIRNLSPLFAEDQLSSATIDDTDSYYKGAWILHTIRQLVNDDRLWFKVIRSFVQQHLHKTVDTDLMISFFSEELEEDLSPMFKEYLTFAELPIFDYRFKDKGKKASFQYRCISRSPGFVLPIRVFLGGEWQQLFATKEWQEYPSKGLQPYEFDIDPSSSLFKVISDNVRGND